MRILGVFKSGAILLSKHRSAVLAGTAIASAVGTVYLAIKGTIKSVPVIEKMKKDLPLVEKDGEIVQEDLKKTEIVKAVWKNYIPTAVGLVTTVTCVVCAHRIDAKRIATATSALLLSEKMNKELEKKSIEELGTEKVKEIKNKIFGKDPELKKAYENKGSISKIMGEETPTYRRSHDEVGWFKEPFFGRTFQSTRLEVEQAMMNATKEAIRGSGIISMNEFYDFLGLDPCDGGDLYGWRIGDGQELDVGGWEPDIMPNGMSGLIMHYINKPSLI